MDHTNWLRVEGIRLQLPSVSYKDAIDQAGRLLVHNGYVNQTYIATMFEREQEVSTFIGHGTAIPHGLVHGPDMVHESGIVVLQYPHGIQYGTHICYLVIGISSKPEDHLLILQHISNILSDDDLAGTLWTTENRQLVHSIFTKGDAR